MEFCLSWSQGNHFYMKMLRLSRNVCIRHFRGGFKDEKGGRGSRGGGVMLFNHGLQDSLLRGAIRRRGLPKDEKGKF